MNEKINAVIYARFSSHNQQEQSIEGQLRYCSNYANKNGMTVINSYIDRAISGTSDNRPSFQQMIKDSNNRKFDVVLVWKLDRFARNKYDSVVYKNKLKKNGVKVISVTEYLGEGTESVLLESLLEAMAETYSRQLSENVQRGMRESAMKGLSTGGNIPLGYKIVDKKYVIDEAEAEIIRYIFNNYADGKPKKQIIDEINAKGWRTKKGCKFKYNSFNTILKNRKYIGEYIYQDLTVKDVIPAIVDVDIFNQVQSQMAQNKRTAGTQSAKREYLLSTKLFCGQCGGAMTGETSTGRHGGKYGYYMCRNKKFHKNNCEKKRERQEELEEFVVQKTVAMYSDKQFMQLIAKKVVKLYNDEFGSNHIATLEENKHKLETRFDELSNALVKTTNARMLDKFNSEIEQIDIELQELEIEIARENSIAHAQMTVDDVIDFINEVMRGNIKDKEFQKQIIDTFINAIYVFDDKLVIYYNGSSEAEKVNYSDMLKDMKKGATSSTLAPPNVAKVATSSYLISDNVFKTFALIARR